MLKENEISRIKNIKERCTENAKNFVNAAKELSEFPNIQHHLASLAIEEIGKIHMCWKIGLSGNKDGNRIFFNKKMEDHEKKLFLGLLGEDIIGSILNKKIEDYRDLAKTIHHKRLSSLYVDPDSENIPMNEITKKQAKDLLGLAEARIKLEELHTIKDSNKFTESEKWLIETIENDTTRKFLLGKTSMTKYMELNDFEKWRDWAFEENIKLENDLKEILEAELNKNTLVNDVNGIDKWEIKVRFFSRSHNINQLALNKWNYEGNKIKFFTGKNKSEIICHIILTNSVPLTDVFNIGMYEMRLVLISMNIATFGFFWTSIDIFKNKYYEEIIDLENKDYFEGKKPTVNIELTNNLEKKKQSPKNIDDEEIQNLRMVSIYIWSNHLKFDSFLNEYYLSLIFYFKSDLLFTFAANSLVCMCSALEKALIYYYKNTSKEKLESFIQEEFEGNLDLINDSIRILNLANESRSGKHINISYDDIYKFKLIFDNLIVRESRKHVVHLMEDKKS